MMRFEAELLQINDWIIVRLPQHISDEFPSRGMVMLQGGLNNVSFKAPVEPDGTGGHWFRVSDDLADAAGILAGDRVSLTVAPLDEWLEPELPEDLRNALVESNQNDWWSSLTTKARWEWIRWIRSTRNPQTRQKRIQTAISKMESGMKRPCCFNSTQCTEMAVSKKGMLDFQI